MLHIAFFSFKAEEVKKLKAQVDALQANSAQAQRLTGNYGNTLNLESTTAMQKEIQLLLENELQSETFRGTRTHTHTHVRTRTHIGIQSIHFYEASFSHIKVASVKKLVFKISRQLCDVTPEKTTQSQK